MLLLHEPLRGGSVDVRWGGWGRSRVVVVVGSGRDVTSVGVCGVGVVGLRGELRLLDGRRGSEVVLHG